MTGEDMFELREQVRDEGIGDSMDALINAAYDNGFSDGYDAGYKRCKDEIDAYDRAMDTRTDKM